MITNDSEFCPNMFIVKKKTLKKKLTIKKANTNKRFRILSSYARNQKEAFVLIDEPNFCNIINETQIETQLGAFQSPAALSEYHTPNCIENLPVLSILTGVPSG